MPVPIKRFDLSLETRTALASASQEYAIPMQEIAGRLVDKFVRDYQNRDPETHRMLATWREQYTVKLAARISRSLATRKANRNVYPRPK